MIKHLFISMVSLLIIMLIHSNNYAQKIKKHELRLGIFSLNSYRDTSPFANTHTYYNRFFDTFQYAFSVVEKVSFRTRAKLIDYRYEYLGGEVAEFSDRFGFEAGLGVEYNLALRAKFASVIALEAFYSKLKTDGIYYNDYPPYESRKYYDRETLGVNFVIGGKYEILSDVFVVAETHFIFGNTRVKGEMMESAIDKNGYENYVHPLGIIGIAYKI